MLPAPAGRPPTPLHLLELTIISAQDLHPATRSMHTYASAWVHPDEKLFTRVDASGHANPSWNHKLLFQVDDDFVRSSTALVTVQLHALRSCVSPRVDDHLLGTVGIVVSSFRPAPGTRRFVALQVRRPRSLRPQGLLNVSVAFVDVWAKGEVMSYDLYMTPAFSYKDFIGGKGAKTSGMMRWSVSGEYGEKAGEKEREELESKLEMWKAEMSPEDDRKGEKSGRRFSCFCGGNVIE